MMGNCFSDPQTTSSAGQADYGAPVEPAIKKVDTSKSLENSLLGRINPNDVTEDYELDKVLGRGQFGTTRLCVQKKSGKTYACKSILKKRLAGIEDIANVKLELEIMLHLEGNANIVKLIDAYEDHLYVHLVMELCTGGDMVDRICSKGHFSEKDAAALTRTLLSVVTYCHELDVCHRDLKPDNFLLSDGSDQAALKVTDFGLSTFYKPGKPMHDIVGTAYYMSPELLKGQYTEKADVWSVGIILYIMLCGRPPFDAPRDEDVHSQILKCPSLDCVMQDQGWECVSDRAKDAILKMCTKDPKQRPSAREMLEHEWIREGGCASDEKVVEPEVLQRMKHFAAMNKLKKEALMVIASHLPPDQINGLKQVFRALDANGDGIISTQELKEGLAAQGGAIPQTELQALMDLADINHNGALDYEEFLAATVHMCKLEQEENILQAFKHFDKDGSGFITVDELKEALREHAVNDAELDLDVDDVVAKVDQDGDKKIDYLEFCNMMLGDSCKKPSPHLERVLTGKMVAPS